MRILSYSSIQFGSTMCIKGYFEMFSMRSELKMRLKEEHFALARRRDVFTKPVTSFAQFFNSVQTKGGWHLKIWLQLGAGCRTGCRRLQCRTGFSVSRRLRVGGRLQDRQTQVEMSSTKALKTLPGVPMIRLPLYPHYWRPISSHYKCTKCYK